MDGNVSLPVGWFVGQPVQHFHPDWNISTTTRWIATKFGNAIHDQQTMNPTDFGDPLIFLLVLLAGHSFYFFSVKYLNNCFDRLKQNLLKTFMVHRGWILITYEVHICGCKWNVWRTFGWLIKKSGTHIHVFIYGHHQVSISICPLPNFAKWHWSI